MIFSIIKAFSKYEDDLGVGEKERIKGTYEVLSNIDRFLRKKINTFTDDIYNEKISSSPNNEMQNLALKMVYIGNKISEIRSKIRTGKEIRIDEIKNIVYLLNDLNSKFGHKFLNESIPKLDKIFQLNEDKNELITKALRKALISEFYSQISFSGESEITCIEGNEESIHFGIEKNNITDFRYSNDIYFEESTFVESPIFLHLYDALKYANTLFEFEDKSYSLYRNVGKVTFHVKDLISKLEKADYLDDFDLTSQSILHQTTLYEILGDNKKLYDIITEISNICNGDIKFCKEIQRFCIL